MVSRIVYGRAICKVLFSLGQRIRSAEIAEDIGAHLSDNWNTPRIMGKLKNKTRIHRNLQRIFYKGLLRLQCYCNFLFPTNILECYLLYSQLHVLLLFFKCMEEVQNLFLISLDRGQQWFAKTLWATSTKKTKAVQLEYTYPR